MNPHPMLALNAISPRSIRNAVGYAPAGNLNSGVPGASLPVGAYRFQTKIRVAGYRPTINATGLASSFATALRTAASGIQSVTIAATAIADAPVQMTFASGTPSVSLDSWWVTIVGTIAVSGTTPLEHLNKAIAAAFVRSTAFAERFTLNGQPVTTAAAPSGAMARPTNNSDSYLMAVLRQPTACSGLVQPNAVFRQACTRWEPLSAAEAQSILTRLGTAAATQAATQAAAHGVCTIRSQEAFFLRPTATFAQTGPRYPAGTTVTITGPQHSVQGAYTLFPVRVGTATGWAAFNAAEVAACRAASQSPTVSIPGGPTVTLPSPANLPGVTTPAPSTPSPTPAPAPSTTAVTPSPSTTLAPRPPIGASISQQGMSTGAKTALIVGGTAVALTGVGLGLYYALGTLDKPAPRARG